MSISPNMGFIAPSRPDITAHILALFTDDRIRGKILVPLVQSLTVRLLFFNLQIGAQTQPIILIQFSDQFPASPPRIFFDSPSLSPLLLQSSCLDSWNQHSSLADVVVQLYKNLSTLLYCDDRSLRDRQENEDKVAIQKQSSQDGKKWKVMMNGCADNELTETKNLNRHFRSKLREVYYDLVKLCSEIPEDAKWIESSFTMSRVGFEDIARVLKNDWFNKQVEKQMENGRFMHKIMKGMMSIKSKKLMVKYYHVMLAATKDPDNFVKWKYQ